MTKRALILTIIVAALSLPPTSLWAGPPFSAEHLVRAMSAEEGWVGLDVPLGHYEPVPFSDATPRRVVDAFVKHGLVTATPYGGGLRITPTPKGEALARAAQLPPRPGFLRIRCAKYEVTKLVKSESLKSATGSWQFVLFTFTRDPDPVLIDVQTQRMTRDRKGRALLEYDEFTSKWVIKFWNTANFDEEFRGNLDQEVAGLGLRRE